METLVAIKRTTDVVVNINTIVDVLTNEEVLYSLEEQVVNKINNIRMRVSTHAKMRMRMMSKELGFEVLNIEVLSNVFVAIITDGKKEYIVVCKKTQKFFEVEKFEGMV